MDLKNITIVTPKTKNLNPTGVRLKLKFDQMLEIIKGVQIRKAAKDESQNRSFTENDLDVTAHCPNCKREVIIKTLQGNMLGYGWSKCDGCKRNFHVSDCIKNPK